MQSRKLWADFREEHERRIVAGLAVRSRGEVLTALAQFDELADIQVAGGIHLPCYGKH
jgi:hypothetical protein